MTLSAALSGMQETIKRVEGWEKVPKYGDFCPQCASVYMIWLEDYMRTAPEGVESCD